MPASGSPPGSSSPSWSQFQADAARSGAAAGPAPPYRQAWSHPVKPEGQQGLSAPVLSDELGLVVAVGRTSVLGLDLASGAQRFSLPREAGPPAAAALTTVKGRTVVLYTEGSDADSADLRAVDLKTRHLLWAKPVALTAPSRSGVTIDGTTAVVGDQKGTVTAVDIATGKVAWTRAEDGPRSSIVVGGGHVVLTTGPAPGASAAVVSDLVSLSASTGAEEWHTALNAVGGAVSGPAIVGSRVVLAASDGSSDVVSAFSLDDGSKEWSSTFFPAPFSQLTFPVIASSDPVVIDATGDVRRIAQDSGTTRWDFALNATSLRPPAVSGSTLLAGLNDGTLVAIDTGSGTLVWRSAPVNGPVGYLAVGHDTIVAVRGGGAAGLVAYTHDVGGTLLAEESPTQVRWGVLVGWFLLAAVVAVAVLLLIGRTALARLGVPLLPEADDQDDDDDDQEPEG